MAGVPQSRAPSQVIRNDLARPSKKEPPNLPQQCAFLRYVLLAEAHSGIHLDDIHGLETPNVPTSSNKLTHHIAIEYQPYESNSIK